MLSVIFFVLLLLAGDFVGPFLPFLGTDLVAHFRRSPSTVVLLLFDGFFFAFNAAVTGLTSEVVLLRLKNLWLIEIHVSVPNVKTRVK